ncbi:MAG: CHASE2 domain-containing serine/threonine-protein kinase [Coleofasciculus sp. C1-SOL-03]|uniref:CHASE2 domain-containing protein n=1 Tax=Coleofasciculus sp. C1-SOL-03 TaxID=3069522 RepID=UPI0032FB1143
MKETSGELYQNHALEQSEESKLSVLWSRLKRIGSLTWKNPVLLTSLAVTGVLLGTRQLALLEPLELYAYDRLMQLRPSLPPDPRLLVVEVTEQDTASLEQWQSREQWPMTDALMHKLLSKLQQHEPTVIGLDLYRDIPIPPGNPELTQLFKQSDNIIPICRLGDETTDGTPPPESVPPEQVGFADLAIDEGGVVRRALLFHSADIPEGCNTPLSFSFQLARFYLEKQGIEPQTVTLDEQDEQDEQEYLKWGDVIFKPLQPKSGGYQRADAGGYQILLNYRSGDKLADTVTLADVLEDRVDPSLVKDRIVLIGISDPAVNDLFFTPYSSEGDVLKKMPGVVVHGQIVSQLLSTVLNERKLFWFMPEWGEVLWIGFWSLTGGILIYVTRNIQQLLLAEIVAIGLVGGISFIVFLEAGWIPVITPILGLVMSSTGVLAYSAYQNQQERAHFARLLQEQENNLIALQGMLQDSTRVPLTTQDDEDDDKTLIADQHEVTLSEETAIAPSPQQGNDSTAIWTPDAVTSPPAPTVKQSDNPNLLAGRYKINRVLGSGGFGLTYLAEDSHRPGKPKCVVKHLKPARRDERFLAIARRLFHTEAEILEKLGRHAQIPQLLAYFEESREFYLVEEYIKGDSLSDELPVDKRMPEEQVITLIKGLLEILVFIHDHNVIHRDIKPSNIIRRQTDGNLVLIDFGAVKQIQPQQKLDQEHDTQEHHTVAVGTRGYAPSEQYAGHPTLSSDIYAVGVIGIQALTGIPPHQLVLDSETGEISWRHLANVSKEFAEILEKMVRYYFMDRYQSVTKVLEDLSTLPPKS